MSDHHGWKAFERKMAKALGTWWEGNPKHFRRLPLKNGWPWGDGKGSDIVRILNPDIITPSSDQIDYSFPFFCECKKRKSMNLTELIGKAPKNPKGSHLIGWYIATAERAAAGNKWPMLFAKFPRSHKTFLVVPTKILPSGQRKKIRGVVAKMPGAPRGMKNVFICEVTEFFQSINKKKLNLDGREEVTA
jgi:hypothetical protein